MASSASRFLVLVLTLLVVAGHVCELPLDAIVHGHGHDGPHEAADHHRHDGQADESQLSCDPVTGISSTGIVRADRGPDVAVGSETRTPSAPVRLVATQPRARSALSGRPPLFLLHSSLLI